jgi:xyloglucan-specific exo-beta-1,4-glucanase
VTAQFKAHGNGMGRSNGERLQVDPGSSNVLYVGTRHNGLFKSVDSGATWNRINGLNINETPNGNGISFVLLDPTSVKQGTAKRIFVGVSRYGSVGAEPVYQQGRRRHLRPGRRRAGRPDAAARGDHQQGPPVPDLRQRRWTARQSESEPMNTGAIWEYNTVGGAWTNVTPANRSHPFGGISVDPGNPKRLVATTLQHLVAQTRGRPPMATASSPPSMPAAPGPT